MWRHAIDRGKDIFVDLRTDLDTRDGGLRAISTTFGINRPLVQAFQSFYYTRAIELVPSLAQFADARGNEPGTLRGSQWGPSVFLGDRERGLFGGTYFLFRLSERDRARETVRSSVQQLRSAIAGIVVRSRLQNYTFNVGVRKENRLRLQFPPQWNWNLRHRTIRATIPVTSATN